jgi:hypothetical protein
MAANEARIMLDPLYLLLISIPAAAFVTWWLLSDSHRRQENSAGRRKKGPGSANESPIPQPTYRSAKLSICTNACEAAKRIRTKTFLVNEAPRLPLASCDRICHCNFALYDDRRLKDDRRYPSEDIQDFQDTTTLDEGRTGSDRRAKTAPYHGIY